MKIDRHAVYEKYGGRCAYCGNSIEFKDMQVDHIFPQRLGGTDDFGNLNPSCRLCNHYKRANKLETFRSMIEAIPRKLDKIYIYRVGKRYGLVEDDIIPVQFYFEKVAEAGAEKETCYE